MHRQRRVIVVVVAVVALWPRWPPRFRFVFVPNWRPPLVGAERYGVDVSAHQGEMTGNGSPTTASSSPTSRPPRAKTGWTSSSPRTGLIPRLPGSTAGAYHFFTLCAPGDEQARNFLRVAPPDEDALPPAIDLELAGNCRLSGGVEFAKYIAPQPIECVSVLDGDGHDVQVLVHPRR